MKKLLLLTFLSFTGLKAFSQSIMTVVPDSSTLAQFSDFVGVKISLSDIGLKPLNENLQFNYLSANSGYTYQMHHSMDIQNFKNMPNLSVGVEEDYGHLLINFADIGIGFYPNAFNWNAGAGVGYFGYLNKKKTLSLRAYVNVFYENIAYFLGSYNDTTLLGFVVDGSNIGTIVKNVKYTNNLLCASPDIELLYRREKLDFFVGIGYDIPLLSRERINFYRTTIPLSQGLYNSSGIALSDHAGAIIPQSYIIKIGIVKEFGL
jgi:hypothetical protein